jgi:multicomponent Na+:H+ antiporter subunit E
MWRKLYFSTRLGLSFAYQLVLSNLDVARTVLRPALRIEPGIVEYRTDLVSDLAITWLANLITLTPGTLTLYLSDDCRTLYIHTLNVRDPKEVVSGIRASFERYLLELER